MATTTTTTVSSSPLNIVYAHPFFKNQEIDEVGKDCTKLERLIVLLFLVSVLAFIFNIAEEASYGAFGFIWLPIFFWVLLFGGFYGAYRRNHTLLLIYLIITIISVILSIIYIIEAFVGIAAVATICAGLGNLCTVGYNIGAIIALWIITVILLCIYTALQIYACILANRLRTRLRGAVVVTTTTMQQQPNVIVMQQPVMMQQPMMVQQQQPMMMQQQQPMMMQQQQPMMMQQQPMMVQTGTVVNTPNGPVLVSNNV